MSAVHLLWAAGLAPLRQSGPPAAWALSGGALWYQSPIGDPPHFMGALMSGMVILMIPAFLICAGITVLAYRKRKQWAGTEARREGAAEFDVATDVGDEPWR